MHDAKFETDVAKIAKKMWRNPRVREWCAKWGMREYPEFLADCLRIARAARDAGGPWVDALDI